MCQAFLIKIIFTRVARRGHQILHPPVLKFDLVVIGERVKINGSSDAPVSDVTQLTPDVKKAPQKKPPPVYRAR